MVSCTEFFLSVKHSFVVLFMYNQGAMNRGPEHREKGQNREEFGAKVCALDLGEVPKKQLAVCDGDQVNDSLHGISISTANRRQIETVLDLRVQNNKDIDSTHDDRSKIQEHALLH